MQKKLITTFVLAILMLSTFVCAISADEAVAIISVQNNYLMSGESTSVAKELIQYKGVKYIVVAATQNDSVNCYIPLNSTTGEVAQLDLEIREVIRTTIIYSKMNELNQSITAANWPLSYYTKNTFQSLGDQYGDFTKLKTQVLTVKTELEKISAPQALIDKADNIQDKIDEIVAESKKLAEEIEAGREYEQNFFSAPDANKITKYEGYYTSYFTDIISFKSSYDELNSKLYELSQAIATLETDSLSVSEKSSIQSSLSISYSKYQTIANLSTIFSQTDELRTLIESIFTNAKNSENYATTLASREVRNSAWKEMYGQNEGLLKVDKSFETLEIAANAILSTDNINQWEDSTSVDALSANWTAAKSRYNNAEYEKAKEYAIKAQKNVSQVIEGGVKQTEDKTNDYLMIIIGVLVIALVGLFVYENFYLKKKKKKEEEYNEPNY